MFPIRADRVVVFVTRARERADDGGPGPAARRPPAGPADVSQSDASEALNVSEGRITWAAFSGSGRK